MATAFRRLSLESAIAVTLPCMIAHPFRDFQGGVPEESFFGPFLPAAGAAE